MIGRRPLTDHSTERLASQPAAESSWVSRHPPTPTITNDLYRQPAHCLTVSLSVCLVSTDCHFACLAHPGRCPLNYCCCRWNRRRLLLLRSLDQSSGGSLKSRLAAVGVLAVCQWLFPVPGSRSSLIPLVKFSLSSDGRSSLHFTTTTASASRVAAWLSVRSFADAATAVVIVVDRKSVV